MARKRKRAVQQKAKNAIATPTKELINSRLESNKRAASEQVDKFIEEKLSEAEKLIEEIKASKGITLKILSAQIRKTKVSDLHESGYMLDYRNSSVSKKFVSVGPLHMEIKNTKEESRTRNKRQTVTANNTLMETTNFRTPAVKKGQDVTNLLITPKVVPQPKSGQVVVYTQNGSPYLLNLGTMKAELPTEEAPSTRPKRATRLAQSENKENQITRASTRTTRRNNPLNG